MLWGDWNVCVIESLRLPLDKISCTRQFESKLSLHSLASLFPIKEGSTFLSKPLFNSLYDPFGSPYRGQKPSGTRGCNRPTVLNFLPLRLSCKESSTFSPSPSSMVFTPPSVPPFPVDRNLRKRGCNRPTRCSEPLRYKVGGPSKVFARLCGMGPPGDNLLSP